MSQRDRGEGVRYYKAVRRLENDKLVSLSCNRLHGDWVVEYLPGEWVEGPNSSGLFIDNIAHCYEGAEIWRVEAREVEVMAVALRTMLMTYPTALRGFWKHYERVMAMPRMSAFRLRGVDYMRIVPCYVAKRVRLVSQEWVSDITWRAVRSLRGEP